MRASGVSALVSHAVGGTRALLRRAPSLVEKTPSPSSTRSPDGVNTGWGEPAAVHFWAVTVTSRAPVVAFQRMEALSFGPPVSSADAATRSPAGESWAVTGHAPASE